MNKLNGISFCKITLTYMDSLSCNAKHDCVKTRGVVASLENRFLEVSLENTFRYISVTGGFFYRDAYM